jgi:uncharacterized membrane protein YGL010W
MTAPLTPSPSTTITAAGAVAPAAGLSPALAAHFKSYAAFHRTEGNQRCHMIAIPAIVLTTLSLLSQVRLVPGPGFALTLADVVFLISTIFYFRMDTGLALRLTLFTTLCLVAGRFMSPTVSLVVFALAWGIQFVGHYAYEKKSPAFLTNAVHLLVGPLWIVAKLSGRA